MQAKKKLPAFIHYKKLTIKEIRSVFEGFVYKNPSISKTQEELYKKKLITSSTSIEKTTRKEKHFDEHRNLCQK